MDPELVKKLRAGAENETKRIFGPISDEIEERMSKLKKVDYSNIIAPESHVLTHLYVDGFVTTPSLARGYFESKVVKFNENDVVLASFPKCGTTWVQEILFLIMNDLDFVKAKVANIDERVPYIEFPECTLKTLQEMPSPKLVKSHLPYDSLPDGGCNKNYKIVYATRNPKDAIVSIHHFYRMMKPFLWTGTLNDMLNMFINDIGLYCPFGKHALGYWNRRYDGNVLVVKYEDMQKDQKAEIVRIAKFLGKDLTEDQVNSIAYASSFQQMANNPATNHSQWADKDLASGEVLKFMRKGKVGDWKNHFDEAANKKVDEWIARTFAGSDLKYDYEL